MPPDECVAVYGRGVLALGRPRDPAFAVGVNEQLTILPVGEVFTIAHALQDYIEWKRIAAARSHFQVLVTLINFHILPRLAAVPVTDFTGEVLRHFAREVLETPPKRGNQPVGPRRSIDSIVLHSMTAGIAKRIMNPVMTCDQTNRGSRFSPIPGAFCLKTVVMISTAPTSVLISTSVTICDHRSTRLPTPYSGPDNGTYANHPTSGPVFSACWHRNVRAFEVVPNRFEPAT